MVEIVDGLVEGDTILQFVPGAPSSPDGFTPDGGFVNGQCFIQPDGSEICTG
jgi:hypothetical protein